MSVFVDTSALYAFLVETERDHAAIRLAFLEVAEGGRRLLTTNYVVVEASALLQHRIGLAPVRDLDARLLPLIDVIFVDEPMHRRAVERLLRLDCRRVSLVDAVSFEAMETQGVRDVLGLDRDFEDAGFRLIP
jgi:predicted nucleic acid-binding protein